MAAIRWIIDLYFNSFSGLTKDVWLLSLMMLINRCGTMVIIFMTIYLTEDLQWTLTQAGIAMSVFGLGSALGSYLGGWFTDRVGYYPTMFWSLFIGGLSFLVLMVMKDFYYYCFTVFFVSTINDAFRPAALASISAYGKPENHNRSLSLIRLAINLGFGLGIGAGGLISEHLGFDYLFVIDTVTCILAAFFLKMVLKNKKEKVSVQEEELKLAPEGSAYRDKLYLFFAFCIVLMVITFSQLWNTIPVYFTDSLNISKDHYGWIMMVNGLLIFFLEMPLVYVLENRYSKISLIIIGTILITLGFFIYNLTDFWQLAIGISIFAVSVGEMLALPFSNAFALSRSKPGRRGSSWESIRCPGLLLWLLHLP